MGVVNKFLDYLLTYCIEHMAALVLTTWMIQQPAASHSVGADAIDFELDKELLKPWVAIEQFARRWRSCRARGRSRSRLVVCLRFLLALTCSVCFLLSAAAMNTLGLAKPRWYPDDWPNSTANNEIMTLSTPRMTIASIEWSNYRHMGLSTVSNGSQWQAAAYALASASTYTILASLEKIYQPADGVWRGVRETDTDFTLINTNITKSEVKSTSIHGSFVTDMYENAKSHGPSYARSSTGMLGRATLTLPMLTTMCNTGTATESSAGRVLVERSTTANPSLTIQLGPNEGTGSDVAICHFTLQNVLFPVGFYLRDHEGIHLEDTSDNDFDSITVHPTSAVDEANLQRLVTQLSAMLPHLNGLLPNSSFAEHLFLASRRLKQTTLEFETEVESLAPVLALIMQHLLTTATWNMDASTTEIVTSFPIRWWAYGSGPRLRWQWATGAVFSVLALMVSYDVYLTLCHRIAPGPWLKLHGMMHAAYAANPTHSIGKGCVGVRDEATERVEYFIREVREGEAEIVEHSDTGRVLEYGKVYGNAEERWRQSVRECLDELSSDIRRGKVGKREQEGMVSSKWIEGCVI